MTETLLFLLQAVLAFSVGATAFWLRHYFGMAPLYFAYGALEGFKQYVAVGILVALPGIGMVSPASAVFYVLSLALVMLVYYRAGLQPARQLLWSMLYISVLLVLLHIALRALIELPSTVLADPRRLEIQPNIPTIHLLGSVLLFVGALVSILIFNAISRYVKGFFIPAALSMALVIVIDTVFYDLFNDGWAVLNMQVFNSNLIGKIGMGIFYAGIGSLYLRFFDPLEAEEAKPRDFDLLSALTYRRRIADLERELSRDSLTQAFNRRYLDHTLPQQITMDARKGQATVLMIVDLDHFKQINDQHGHLTGDIALKHVASLMFAAVRRSDSVVRYGGDEFIVILPSTTLEEAFPLAERLRHSILQTPLIHNGHRIELTVSIGLSETGVDGFDARTLLQRADARMYECKRTGRNRIKAP